jgi:hypothetical protein
MVWLRNQHRGKRSWATIFQLDFTQSFMDRVVDGWANLELETPGHDGEELLGYIMHGWIF